jgi:hypothetical protein
MNYRIINKPWRDDLYGKIRDRFVIEKLVPKGFILPERWVEMKELNCYMGDSFKSTFGFSEKENACAYVGYLQTPTPPNEEVTCTP